ncbi:hypothetical protein [Massilia phyllosphaerae]|uniref:hypothetical protein n=1 Tax=Massilia phyllosphaerae TaxID=3106034 RepID=UPI002B1CC642|nr:hypothetical protein [Massilia sp. SGZ-792]
MTYQSKPEATAAKALLPLGFIPCNNDLLPFAFEDKSGPFNAMADFYHPEWDLYVEVKDRELNAKTSKATAEAALARVDPARYHKAPTYYQIQNGWNHAAVKQGIVQSTIGGPQYAVIFTGKPTDKTIELIEKRGIRALSLARFVSIVQLQQAFLS